MKVYIIVIALVKPFPSFMWAFEIFILINASPSPSRFGKICLTALTCNWLWGFIQVVRTQGGGEGRGYSWCVYISANFALHNVNLPLTSTVLFSLSINNTCIDDSKSSQLCSTDFKTCSGCSGKSLVSSSMCSCDVDTAGPLSELLFLGDIVAVGLQTSALSYTTKMKETYYFIRILTKPRKTIPL